MPAACAAWRVWSTRSPGALGCGPAGVGGPEMALGGPPGAGTPGTAPEACAGAEGVCGPAAAPPIRFWLCWLAQYWPACARSGAPDVGGGVGMGCGMGVGAVGVGCAAGGGASTGVGVGGGAGAGVGVGGGASGAAGAGVGVTGAGAGGVGTRGTIECRRWVVWAIACWAQSW